MKKNLLKLIVKIGIFAGGLLMFGTALAYTIPIVTDFYSDSLQSGINQTATSFTLVKGIDGQGNALSGPYGFTLDQGTPSQENVFCLSVSGTSASSCVRGLDLTIGTSSVAALEQVHNRGSSVQITTAPILNILANIFRGIEGIPNLIHYDVEPTWSAAGGTSLVTLNKLNTTAFGGAVVNVGSGGTGGTSFQVGGLLTGNGTSPFTITFNPTIGFLTATSTATSTFAGPIVDTSAATSSYSGNVTITGNASTTGTSVFNGNAVFNQSITYGGVTLSAPKFGGTGVDGALSISSGTTTINTGGAAVVEKDYTSISITGTGSLNFTGTTTNSLGTGTQIILRSQNACTLTSSSLTMIDLRWLGGGTGNAFLSQTVGTANGAGGGGGGSTSGSGGTGTGFGAGTNTFNEPGIGGVAVTPLASSTRMALPGGNGSAGSVGSSGATAGILSLGAGGLYLECAGGYNFTTGGINASSANAGTGGPGGGGGTGAGGGGSGGGGNILVEYTTLTADTGTYNNTVGSGGGGGTGTSPGNGGGSGAVGNHLEVKNTYFY